MVPRSSSCDRIGDGDVDGVGRSNVCPDAIDFARELDVVVEDRHVGLSLRIARLLKEHGRVNGEDNDDGEDRDDGDDDEEFDEGETFGHLYIDGKRNLGTLKRWWRPISLLGGRMHERRAEFEEGGTTPFP